MAGMSLATGKMLTELSPIDWDIMHEGSTGLVVVARIRPGMPGAGTRRVPDDAYPSTTPDVMKALRQLGIEVSAPERADLISYNANEVWLPIIEFGVPVIQNFLGGVLASLLVSLFTRDKGMPDIVHIDWSFKDEVGRTASFKFTGPADEAAEAVGHLEDLMRARGEESE